ncbi:hypothetical protein AOQ84DRAFT_31511 [Glonium stellatum]|uniref:Uncharacterized protein n=1 Tax=Glonium stellatum TaxID=574774 RepID=A0A8E2JTV1_9PEZI|nr:hypothetical protein AOQ84DRAFT_31511 [Glonium stellatum]
MHDTLPFEHNQQTLNYADQKTLAMIDELYHFLSLSLSFPFFLSFLFLFSIRALRQRRVFVPSPFSLFMSLSWAWRHACCFILPVSSHYCCCCCCIILAAATVAFAKIA